MIGVGLALAAAGLWGFGDFAGGLGVRRGRPFGVLFVSAASGLLLLGAAWLVRPEAWPGTADALWALGAGASGALGLTALYTGLARGRVAVVASSTAVVGATLPVLFGLILHGLLGGLTTVGLCLALVGLFLVTHADANSERGRGGLSYGVLAGVGVSGFLIGMAQLSAGVLWPLILARGMGMGVALLALGLTRSVAGPLFNRWAIAAGLFDAGGNLLYVVALEYLPLEVAAVVSSLYPAVTVLLAARFLGQPVAVRQGLGVALCLSGVALISSA